MLKISCCLVCTGNVLLLLCHMDTFTDQLKALETDKTDDSINAGKFGIGNINLAMKNGWCPIHFAASNEHQVCF